MKKILIILVSSFFILIYGCKPLDNNTSVNKKSQEVSLISIIANPNKYHKKSIIVKGFFTMETEGQAIFISKNDYQTMIYKNAIYLYIGYDTLKQMDIEEPYKGYVQIEGVFNKNLKGSYGFYSGGIEKITKISRLYKKGTLNDELNMD
ncbi:hypothetical protein OX284_012115 [Flavobacterium sp. SUN046]|uniref:hypothetical protein n=1 Tax=Flavobacterium sp. SUN046 TaxID=3002440 RepID=UPI002DB57F2D|nr:hypothetical protein [Flavobacterium sp. SUN046]MEC4050179.1 hypothetical protein [Flavobacterium sp. SUN046]